MITDVWDCTRCKQSVSANGKNFWLIRGDMMLRFRCTKCRKRRDRQPTEKERELIAGAWWSRRANRKEMASFKRQFLAELKNVDHLAEIARREGNWRSQ